jgi:hypothetical protein
MAQDMKTSTLTVQPIGTTNPTSLANAALVPLRVLVRNVGPVTIFIAVNTVDLLTPTPGVASYLLVPGEEDVFIINTKQVLLAVGTGPGGFASVAISDALPANILV